MSVHRGVQSTLAELLLVASRYALDMIYFDLCCVHVDVLILLTLTIEFAAVNKKMSIL